MTVPMRANELDSESLGDRITANRGIIELHLRQVQQLFDALDASPFRERDLDRKAEEFIVDSAKELPPKLVYELVIHLDEPLGRSDEQRAVGDAVRVYFARRSNLWRRNLRQLLHRGRVSLAIGFAFLAALLIVAQLVVSMLGESAFGALLRESLLIVGWVAMWKPIEIFLYEWWPIVGEQRFYDRLSRIRVQIVHQRPEAEGAQHPS